MLEEHRSELDPPPAEGSAGTRVRNRRKRRLPKTLSRAEAQRFLEAFNLRAPTGLRNRCAFELMYRAGLRVGELGRLESRDVDTKGGTIRILDGKGGDGTAYFDTSSVSELIGLWREERKRRGITSSSPLFCTLAGEPLTPRYLQQVAKRIAKRAGLDPGKVTPHVFRHSFATELLDEGFNIRKVQEALRHKDLETTMVYTHVLDAELRRQIQRRRRSSSS